jgi:hypothetical protein
MMKRVVTLLGVALSVSACGGSEGDGAGSGAASSVSIASSASSGEGGEGAAGPGGAGPSGSGSQGAGDGGASSVSSSSGSDAASGGGTSSSGGSDVGPGSGGSDVGPGSGGSDVGPGSGGSDVGPGSSSSGGNAPPIILSISANTAVLTQNQTLILTVVATDPDGIDDLIGGVVRTPGGLSYGALATSGQEGSYSLAIPWSQLHTTEPIDAGEEGIGRTFEIVLFDTAANQAEASLSVTLRCSLDDWGLCGGTCTDLDTDARNCGVCGFDCTEPHGGTLLGGVCEDVEVEHYCRKTKFVSADASTGDRTCNQLCAEAAGPEAYGGTGFADMCDLIGGQGGCVTNCDTSFDDMPDVCIGPGTLIRCRCQGYYLSPG